MKRRWQQSELDVVRRLYPDHPTDEIARQVGRTPSSVYQTAYRMGLTKSREYLEAKRQQESRRLRESGKSHRFPKGATPWNKGKHHNPPGSEKGRFKPGHKPQTWQPVGSECVTDGIRKRKVTDTGSKSDWRPVHVLLWEQHHGPVPKGLFLVFANRDQTDIRLDNLMLVDRAENMRRNTVHRYPNEVVSAIRQLDHLERRIKESS